MAKVLNYLKNLWSNVTPLAKLLAIVMLLLLIFNIYDFAIGGKGNIFYVIFSPFIKEEASEATIVEETPSPLPITEEVDLRESIEKEAGLSPDTVTTPTTPEETNLRENVTNEVSPPPTLLSIPSADTPSKKSEKETDINIEEIKKFISASRRVKIEKLEEKRYVRKDPYEPVIKKKVIPRKAERIDLFPLLPAIPAVPEEEYHLKGVIIDRKPVAIIESDKKEYIVNVGDKVDEYKVIFISSNKVILKSGFITKELRFE